MRCRNLCTPLASVISVIRLLIATLLICWAQFSFAAPEPSLFTGNWEMRYPCTPGMTEPFLKRCQTGEGDSFSLLNVTQRKERICGYHVATAYGTNKVDEGEQDGLGPSINGAVHATIAVVTFRSTRGGSLGQATITRRGDTLVWHVTKPIVGAESYFPRDAVLSRYVGSAKYRAVDCGAKSGDK